MSDLNISKDQRKKHRPYYKTYINDILSEICEYVMFVKVFMGFIKSSLGHLDDIDLSVIAAFMSGSSACVDGGMLQV